MHAAEPSHHLNVAKHPPAQPCVEPGGVESLALSRSMDPPPAVSGAYTKQVLGSVWAENRGESHREITSRYTEHSLTGYRPYRWNLLLPAHNSNTS